MLHVCLNSTLSFYPLYLGTTNNTIISNVMIMAYVSIATIGCSFSTNQCFYCMVCCSTDPSVPPDSSVYNISTTRGTEVTVSLQGLTSGQMYYCKAAATNTNSTNCAGPVVGGGKVFFSFMTSVIIPSSSSPTSTTNTSICEYCLWGGVEGGTQLTEHVLMLLMTVHVLCFTMHGAIVSDQSVVMTTRFPFCHSILPQQALSLELLHECIFPI